MNITQRLADALGLTRSEAVIVARLAAAGGRWVETGLLNATTADLRSFNDGWRKRCDSTIKVHVFFIRKKLGADFILGHQQYGFTLGAPGVLGVRRALAENAAA